MRVVHFSDIHLSYDNYQYFKTVYINALINDLKEQNKNNPFDLIIISGDLVDRGGKSLYKIREYKGRELEITPFEIFEQLFIDRISSELSISKNNFLFVPGNHDIDESGIKLKEESDLIKSIINKYKHNVTELIEANHENFKYSKRIQEFKNFEANYHNIHTDSYEYTNNQSTYIYCGSDDVNYGILLLNDSWRCKSVRLAIEEKEGFQLNLGSKQIYDGLESLRSRDAHVIICVMHHPLEKFNDKEEIQGIFKTEDIDIVLFGDLHQTEFETPNSISGKYISSQCKASFSNQHELNINYLCGYQILDVNKSALASISFRYYDGRNDKKKFLPDVSMGTDGIFKNENGLGIPFSRKSKIDTNSIENFRN